MRISINKLDYAHMLYMAICDYDYYHWLESFRDDDDDVFTDIYENNASLSLNYFTDIVNDDDDDAAADILMMIREYRKMMR